MKVNNDIHLDLEALHIVISNPGSLVVGIWHILGAVPSLGGSLLQESADLMAGRRLKLGMYTIRMHMFSCLTYGCTHRFRKKAPTS